MNTSRLQLIVEELIEASRQNNSALSLIGEMLDEIESNFDTPTEWKNIFNNISYIYKDDDIIDGIESY